MKRDDWIPLGRAILTLAFTALHPAGAPVSAILAEIASLATTKNQDDEKVQISRAINDLLKKSTRILDDFDEFERHGDADERRAAAQIIQSVVIELSEDFELLARAGLNDSILAERIVLLAKRPLSTYSQNAESYANRLASVSARIAVGVLTSSPTFDRTLSLKTYLSLKETPARLEESLNQIFIPSQRRGTPREYAEYEAEYLESLAHQHGSMQLFGLDDVPPALAWTPLDPAYISLSATRPLSPSQVATRAHHPHPTRLSSTATNTSVENAIALTLNSRAPGVGVRLFATGSAGSGKTTLCHWLALRMAMSNHTKDSLPPPLRDLIGQVPFVLTLRSIAHRGVSFQGIETLLNTSADAPPSPGGWLEEVVTSGRAFIIMDGLDELPKQERSLAQRWVKEILRRYPRVNLLLSARPEAADYAFLTTIGASTLSLTPMNLEQSRLLVDKWFDVQCSAAPQMLVNRYRQRQGALRREIDINPNVRDLSETPLLAAILCAYYASGSQERPTDRTSLIGSVLAAMIDGRERARGLVPDHLVSIGLGEKLALLGDLAHNLFLARATIFELRTTAAAMPVSIDGDRVQLEYQPPVGTQGTLMQYLSDRSGILPSIGDSQYQFVHRVFLEYMAAHHLVEIGDAKSILDNMEAPGWLSVTPFFAALAPRHETISLSRALLDLAQVNTKREVVYCAAACIGILAVAPSDILDRASEALAFALPPNSGEEVASLASLGDRAIRLLPTPRTSDELSAHILTAVRVRGPEALRALEAIASAGLTREQVLDLLDAWIDFDAEEYALRVLGKVDLTGVEVKVRSSACAGAARLLPSVEHISVHGCEDLHDLTWLVGGHLKRLDLSKSSGMASLDGVELLEHLVFISLPEPSAPVTLAPLSKCVSLHGIWAKNADDFLDWDALSGTIALHRISLHRGSDSFLRAWPVISSRVRWLSITETVPDASFIVQNSQLEHLHLRIGQRAVVCDFSALRCLKELSIEVDRAEIILPDGEWLRALSIEGNSVVLLDAHFLPQLESLRLQGDVALEYVEPSAVGESRDSHGRGSREFNVANFGEMPKLKELSITDNPNLVSLRGVERLGMLRRVDFSGSGIGEVQGLLGGGYVTHSVRGADRSTFEQVTLWTDVMPEDRWSLGACSDLREVNFNGCTNVEDLSALLKLPHLRRADLHSCQDVGTIEALVMGGIVDVKCDEWLLGQETG